jgi:beta-mannosidase
VAKDLAEIKASITLTGPTGERFESERLPLLINGKTCYAALSVQIPNPELWWPNGYGSQPLYDLEVTLRDGETVLDQRNYRIGLRIIELRQDPDQWGKEFTFESTLLLI